jgi:hypothetical protein
VKKLLLIIVTALFFASMVILTLTARAVHNSLIPNVVAERLTRQDFVIETEQEDGYISSYTRKGLAIPKSLYDSGEVYALVKIYVNGEERDAVKRVNVEIGAENDGYYEVISGMWGNEQVVIESDAELSEGVEVFVISS